MPNVPSGAFNYGGSTTFASLQSPTVTAAINQTHPEFQLRYVEPPTGNPSSGKGIEMLLQGQLSFAQSSRAIKKEELKKAERQGLRIAQVPIGIDAIAFYVNPKLINQGLKGITLAQARDIFTGKIKNWKEVGGPDVAITPFSRNIKDSGTVDFLSEKVLEKQKFGASVKEVRDTTESIRLVARTSGGIGYASVSEVINQQTINILAVAKDANGSFISPCADGICTAINISDIANDHYPITRRLFVVIKRDGGLNEQAGTAYANILLSGEGQEFLKQAGFVALHDSL